MSLTRQEVFQALADGKEVEFKPIVNITTQDFTTLVGKGGNYSRLDQFEAYVWRIKPELPPKTDDEIKQFLSGE